MEIQHREITAFTVTSSEFVNFQKQISFDGCSCTDSQMYFWLISLVLFLLR